MTHVLNLLPKLVLVILLLCYLLYALIFLKYSNPTSSLQKKRAGVDVLGIILQSISYAAAWSFRRPRLVPLERKIPWLDIGIALATIVLAFGAVAIVASAKKALGKQWGLAARIVNGHELVTEGPYHHIRQPLYLGMSGLLLATILGVSSLFGLALAFILFSIGTILRIRVEEKLLFETFGKEFEDYSKRVPAFFPRFGGRDT
jgi:protein-S-isoprenylcysteine O-methyltransferase Ste14